MFISKVAAAVIFPQFIVTKAFSQFCWKNLDVIIQFMFIKLFGKWKMNSVNLGL